jgi:hypothetical protein
MKRKIALLMAMIMALTAVTFAVPFSASAAFTSSNVTTHVARTGNVANGTIFSSADVARVGSGNETRLNSYQVFGQTRRLGRDTEAVVADAAVLTIRLDQRIMPLATEVGTEGGHTRQFEIELTNAQWAFIDRANLGTNVTTGTNTTANQNAGPLQNLNRWIIGNDADPVYASVRNYNWNTHRAFGAPPSNIFNHPANAGSPNFRPIVGIPVGQEQFDQRDFRTHMFSPGQLESANVLSAATIVNAMADAAVAEATSAPNVAARTASELNLVLTSVSTDLNNLAAARTQTINNIAEANYADNAGEVVTRQKARVDVLFANNTAVATALKLAFDNAEADLEARLTTEGESNGALTATENQAVFTAWMATLAGDITIAVNAVTTARRGLAELMITAAHGAANAYNITGAARTTLRDNLVTYMGTTTTIVAGAGDTSATVRGSISIAVGLAANPGFVDPLTAISDVGHTFIANVRGFTGTSGVPRLAYPDLAAAPFGRELAYVIEVDYLRPEIAKVTFYIGEGTEIGDVIRIPVIGRSSSAGNNTGSAAIRNVAGQIASVTPVSGLNLFAPGQDRGGMTHRTMGGYVTVGSDLIVRNNEIVIEETQPGTFEAAGALMITAPAGFEFVSNVNPLAPIPLPANSWETIAPSATVSNRVTHPLVNVQFANLPNSPVVSRVSYATLTLSTAQMLHADNRTVGVGGGNNNNLALPSREVPTIFEPITGTVIGNGTERSNTRFVDRTKIIIYFNNIHTSPTALNRGVIVLSNLTLVPTAETILNPIAVTGPQYFTINGARVGTVSELTNVVGFSFPGAGGITASRAGGAVQIDPGIRNSAGNNARITIAERTVGAWNLMNELTFTLTNAAGVPLTDDVKLTGVIIDRIVGDGEGSRNNTTLLSGNLGVLASGALSYTTSGDRGGLPAPGARRTDAQRAGYGEAVYVNNTTSASIFGRPFGDYRFSDDGTSVQFLRNYRTTLTGALSDTGVLLSSLTLQQRFEFRVSAQPDFVGDIYVKISGSAMSSLPEAESFFHIYTVRPRISVEADTTVVGIGHQSIDVKTVKITELISNGLGPIGSEFNLSISELNRPINNNDNFRFNPITMAANVSSTDIGLNMVRSSGQLLVFRIITRGAQAGINASSTGTVTLTGLSIRADRNIPEGMYGVSVTSGNANPGTGGVLQNNIRLTGANLNPDRMLDTFEELVYRVDNFIIVGTPGAPGEGVETNLRVGLNTKVRVATVNGTAHIAINDEMRPLVSSAGDPTPVIVRGGNVMLPVRTLAEAMGARPQDFLFTLTEFQNLAIDTTIVHLGDLTVMFYIGTGWYRVNGGPGMMVSDGVHHTIEDIGYGGRTYVSMRGFAEAFRIPFDPAVNGYAYFNR